MNAHRQGIQLTAEKQVEIFHEPADAQVTLERVAAPDQEIDTARGELPQHPAIEAKRRGGDRGGWPRARSVVLGKHGLAHWVGSRLTETVTGGGAGSERCAGISTTRNGERSG